MGAQSSLLCLVLLMTSMVLGDGVLTPAQSVLGAVYGLQIKTSVSQSKVLPCAQTHNIRESAYVGMYVSLFTQNYAPVHPC